MTPPADAMRELLGALIDYAGLFPPARLDMPAAVQAYAAHRAGPHAWMLARFICPVSRLAEFERAAADRIRPADPWLLSVILDGDPRRDLDAIAAFNEAHAVGPDAHAIIDTLEVKWPDDIDALLESIPDELYPYIEIPVTPDPRGRIAALAGAGAGAKIRTGGITPDAIPSADHVAAFISACAAAGVPFKATAGLHHPLRAEHPLTYEPGCPRAVMHGFLNVFLFAIATLHARRNGGLTPETSRALLVEADPRAIIADGPTLAWHSVRLDAGAIREARQDFARCFGSCSFDEPVADLQAAGLLPR